MKNVVTAAAVCAAGMLTVVGCSNSESGSTGSGTLRLGDTDLGKVTAVTCDTTDNLTTLTIETGDNTGEKAVKKSVVKLSAEGTPTVMSVRIGEVGTTEPALLYSSAAAEDPPTATHQGNQYTVRGTGLGTTAGDPNRPVNTAFDIDVHCP
ncbi:MAG: lipoprotein LpqH [Mycolicibacterium sp.]|uniref:Lipoprotein LpqH n=1 Tax=Mycolicibacterium insubricum TaxID=444597 RepID=A0A1X0DB18_9MYCO|nr:lipoprotein LpqH [Mycolicibacterium insubricum]MCB9439228.1 lipoprotein LpqH [Mycolicibacterium sp.]MCV7082861.1 lipoprotein LpqH [Mycolicibacterium insubricum]ORA69567.1 hypothetical protein BST26_13340 [Mycolicibacterium insubricum]